MSEETAKRARILIVDDQEPNIRLLERILLRAGYSNLASTMDARDVLPLLAECEPDLILLDLHMPHMDGLALMKELEGRIPRDSYLPILVLTADILPATKEKALAIGAKDFLTKPFDATEVLLRARNLLQTRFLYLELQDHNRRLEDRVQERTRELEEAQVEMLERLALASESRDDDTGQHTQRVGELAATLARALGMSDDQVDLIRRAAGLHDIGKIGIPDRILLKPGKLTTEEFEQMKTHAGLGARILSGSRFPLLQLAEEIAFYHHERWDGSGYHEIKGEAIPLVARIVTLADVFDVLTHARPYKEAWPLADAVEEIERQSGRIFDPTLVDAFLQGQWLDNLRRLGQALSPSESSAAFSEHLVFRR